MPESPFVICEEKVYNESNNAMCGDRGIAESFGGQMPAIFINILAL